MKKEFLVFYIIIFLIAIFFSGCFENSEKKETNNFLGMWKTEYPDNPNNETEVLITLTFLDNSTLKTATYYFFNTTPFIIFENDEIHNTCTVTDLYKGKNPNIEWDRYKISGDKLFISNTSYSYEFSNNNEQLIIKDQNKTNILGALDRVKNFEEPKVFNSARWEDINITLCCPDITNWNWINLTRSSIPYTAEHAPAKWGNITIGDLLQIGEYDSELWVGMTWIPTGNQLDIT